MLVPKNIILFSEETHNIPRRCNSCNRHWRRYLLLLFSWLCLLQFLQSILIIGLNLIDVEHFNVLPWKTIEPIPKLLLEILQRFKLLLSLSLSFFLLFADSMHIGWNHSPQRLVFTEYLLMLLLPFLSFLDNSSQLLFQGVSFGLFGKPLYHPEQFRPLGYMVKLLNCP